MKKLLIVLLFIPNICFAIPVTDMSIGKFMHEFNTCILSITNNNIHVTGFHYFSKLNGQDVYKVKFNNNINSRMYVCLKNNQIQQLLFINEQYNDEALRHAIIKVKASLIALGISPESSMNTITKCVKKDDGRVYSFSKQENRLLLIAVDDNDKEINFHILGDE